jgi:transcriptional regulator with XRE-family HTH domain
MAEKPTERGLRAPHLRAWRDYYALTQDELAAKARVARSTVYRAEAGEPISRANARKLAEALGISVLDLLHRAPDAKANPAA